MDVCGILPPLHMRKAFERTVDDLKLWSRGWYIYSEKKLRRFGVQFESQKDLLVDILMARRGSYQRPFLHFSLGMLFIVGVMSAPILAGNRDEETAGLAPPSAVVTSLENSEYGIETQVSKKPRDQVVSYTVAPGDTLSGIAEKFGVSVDTVKWANSIRGESLSIGDELKIPPVTGVVHKVREGDTVYSIAKKYRTDAQKIVNFPFNDFTDLDTFALAVGQSIIVPDGLMAEVVTPFASGPISPPISAGGSGQYLWPAGGLITQYPIWYHNALDIANASAPGIAAAEAGTVRLVEYLRYGYGQHIIIDHGGGYATLYGHLSEIYVKPGDVISRGQIIGRMGSTGRSTGTHLHFEVRVNGVTVNPLPFLK